MKKKGLIVAIFFGVILLTSTVAIALPSIIPPDVSTEMTVTGTPADNFPDSQRIQFCGSGDAKSTPYVKEFKIPTVCTQPLGITTTPDGNVWFVQTNTGKVAQFNPNSETFTEFDNPLWPKNGRSMMWGLDYSPDGTLWYTDEAYDSIWKFSIEDTKYERLQYPSEGDSLPQRLEVVGSQIIVNDFTGNKLTILDPLQSEEGLVTVSLPSEVTSALTADFAVDPDNNIWYTNWVFQQSGVLVKFNHDEFMKSGAIRDNSFTEAVLLPLGLSTPNGAAADNNGNIWLADTSSSYIFKYEPSSESFTQYVTAEPPVETYGNYSGIIKTPISRPYWIDVTDNGKIVFNEQTANRISLLDPITETLVEYSVPSKNPFWGDCGENKNCGLAQIFDFEVHGDKIWFSEWVENNIGVVDTSISLPLDIVLDQTSASLRPGDSKTILYTIHPKSENNISPVSLVVVDTHTFLDAEPLEHYDTISLDSGTKQIQVTLSASENALPGKYKVLLGAETEHIAVSKFVTVTILP